jgi:hypothetical protein
MFYQSLVRRNPTTTDIEPELAQKWEQPAPSEFIFRLAPGVTFHNKAPVHGRALFNLAGSYALEGNKEDARAAYAELIHELGKKQNLSQADKELQGLVRQNLARLADPAQQPKPEQQNQQDQEKQPGGGGPDQKQDQKQDQNQDGKQGQESPDKKPEDGKDQKDKQGQKDPLDQPKDQGQEKQAGQQNQEGQIPPRRGGTPFRERDNMGEEDAKRILGALREHESSLQKKFLNNKAKKGKLEQDDAAKDW